MLKKLFLLAIIVFAGYWVYQHGFGWHDLADSLENGATTAEVLAKIAKENPLLIFSVRVSTHHGHVTLEGHVPTPEARSRVASLAQSVKGITSVEDNLQVAYSLRTPEQLKKDLEITAKVKGKLFQEEGLRGLNIHVDTEHGMVILTGTVPSIEQTVLARKLAASISGVRGVVDRVTVKPVDMK